MYECPLTLIEEAASVLKRNEEDFILNCVREVGVSVDKEELIRALRYDREQYIKGFNDGIRAFSEELQVRYGIRISDGFLSLIEKKYSDN